MKTRVFLLLCVLTLSFPMGSQSLSASLEKEAVITSAVTGGFCPPLAGPTGRVVPVSSVAALVSAVNGALAGDTISIADGVYNLNGAYLRIDTPNVTLRSASRNREAVVLDGNYDTTEIIQIVASNVTIADLTLREAYYHPIHVMSTSSGDVENTLIYNVHIVDPGEQAIKINPYTAENALYFPDDGEIACSHIELTDAGRPHIRNDCYTGGIDGHQARDWVIRDNVIEGFWCPTGLSEHGVHMWVSCRDTRVERNVFHDNARGIGFGMLENSSNRRTYSDDPCPSAGGGYVDHYGGIVRNNFVFAGDGGLFSSQYGFDCGVCLWQACGARVLHNTVVSTQAPFSSIEWRFSNTDVDIVNNLVSHNLRDRGGSATLEGNLINAPLSWFVDGAGGDLHLASAATSAIDQVAAPFDVSVDIDGDSRPIGPASDVGADEYRPLPPAAVTDLRVTNAVTGTSVLTAVLVWSAPAEAITAALRYSETLVAESSWDSATLLTDTLPGDTEIYTAVVPHAGETVYFALRTQGVGGQSDLSNNAFWPSVDVCLPLVLRDD
ncbi:MAG: right-handed parallel beta-helix repeat-containing protein [Anaerolineae bacterium]|nr:right-handed parallel beta-helix repeat-containing protein [Anaerolineae bacterium]